jgi:hypothetical protein
MKVCVVSHSAALTGAERSLLTLLRYLIAHGHAVRVFLPRHGPLEAELEALAAETEVVSIRRWDKNTPGLASEVLQDAQALAKRIHGTDCDVVYTNTSVIPTGALAAALTDIPHVWHVREFVGGDGFLTPRQRADFIRQTSTQVLFNSKAVQDDTSGPEPWPHAQVIYNFVELAPYREAYPPLATAEPLNMLLQAASADAVIACAGPLAAEAGAALRDLHLDIPPGERDRALAALASAGIGKPPAPAGNGHGPAGASNARLPI